MIKIAHNRATVAAYLVMLCHRPEDKRAVCVVLLAIGAGVVSGGECTRRLHNYLTPIAVIADSPLVRPCAVLRNEVLSVCASCALARFLPLLAFFIPLHILSPS